jgi:deoxyguanosine kinase
MSSPQPDYIVVEGPIGVGKTTLAGRLAENFGVELILEGNNSNPFLARFYEEPKKLALPTQLFFLFQRAQQVQKMRQSDLFKPVQVADFLMDKDRLFAELTLSSEELRLYNQVYEQLTIDAPTPDLVIYLQAPVDTLRKRIAKRGIAYEQGIRDKYLQELVDAYVQFFYYYNEAPLLIVNAAEIDLVDNQRDFDLLLEHVRERPQGKHYLNPIELG